MLLQIGILIGAIGIIVQGIAKGFTAKGKIMEILKKKNEED